MKYINNFLLIGLIFLWSCEGNISTKKLERKKIKFNQELADELKRMYEIDQIAAFVRQGKYKELSREEWNLFKDSVFTTNQDNLKVIFEEYGYAGYDLVGKEGARNFWAIAQHSDHNPIFQKKVLEKMKIEVEKENASPKEYALLTDRVYRNLEGKQIYGTQVSYNSKTGQAFIKNLEDSLTVNERRIKVGLEPLENYLNGMSQAHFEMNKENYLKKGITKPQMYKVK